MIACGLGNLNVANIPGEIPSTAGGVIDVGLGKGVGVGDGDPVGVGVGTGVGVGDGVGVGVGVGTAVCETVIALAPVVRPNPLRYVVMFVVG